MDTDEGPPLPLTDMLCFDLYAASRLLTSVYRQVLDPLDLTYPQYLVLVVLWEHGDLSVREVVEQLDLDYGTVSPLLKRLEARGLVVRRRRPEDERSVVVSLTDEGRAMQDRARGVAPAIGAAFGLDEGDAERLRGLLGRVRTSAEEQAVRLAAGAD
ncbi:MarR family transcriptional regulator [Actinotalea ferrariae]|uniref:MarR family winged helix-turn-helix transcriptional regulator n=1 Tax=Actinotalea ferrariae TaxID=1386098 RepID=UPI001ED13D41|nr:MarR family transcriptional regulator [Actinotalea ferrariae]MBX9246596.1 MarR family transcriptional regulator [Actinotalea ferrariae]